MAQSPRPDDIIDELRKMSQSIARMERSIRDQQSVHGYVTSTGAVGRGVGFTCVRNGVGDYTVTFNNPFDADPIVTVSVSEGVSGSISARLHSGTAPNTTRFRVQTFRTTDGALLDCGFNFIAIHA